jgi:hypothetical protein
MKKWDKMEEKARKNLQKSSDQINQSVRGTPSEKPLEWKLGKSPGSSRQWR